MEDNKLRKEIDLKIAFVCEGSVDAKTSFIRRYIGTFDANKSSIMRSYYTKRVVSRGMNVEVQLWDIAGQERFSYLLPVYLRDADGIVVGYDITNRNSFETARRRYMKLKTEYPDAKIMVVGNKADLDECRELSWDEGDELAREICAPLFFEGKYNK